MAAAAALLLAAALVGCRGQAYRVFAVQLTPASAAVAPRASAKPAGRPLTPREQRTVWDLNLVPPATLAELPGITPATVHAMLAGRPYRAKRDLLRRNIVSAAQYDAWKTYLVVHRAPPPLPPPPLGARPSGRRAGLRTAPGVNAPPKPHSH